ncbi:EAL domain-containing protein [Sulfurimonas sp. C5]|uniref:bifunctional diguanylate cyclase/phosphodiesterase n=1 Tax=Sulfurimonas sp. C5 TaxID=3036947 RepID=UPI002457D0BC|nr:EAL domain-containing protein [Sulfurimonas sp. C5]MDH4944875.1 EAL domain-containing protein [Sulfurimonas sp. C5]
MLLPQTKEREYRFKLALRMGLPIFALIVAFISHTLITNYTTLEPSFYIEAIFLLVFTVYFIFYLIYNGFNVKITDDVTKTFAREYLFKYLKSEIKKKKHYTLILISIDNLGDINNLYGIKNGDKVLKKVARWIADYLKNEGIEGFPIGHFRGGDFLVGLDGNKEDYKTVLDLMCLKSVEFKVGDIEVKISGGITDINYSKNLDYLLENLLEIQEGNRLSKENTKEDNIDPNELESMVIGAIKNSKLLISSQDVIGKNERFKECFVKLKANNGKYIFPKTFIKIINKFGLGVEYDLMVFEHIVSLCGNEGKVAINIFPTTLRNEKFLSKVKELMKDKKNLGIIFVLYEMEYFSHTNRYNTIIHSLKEYNISVGIDRIGSIHTSFLYLRELDIDFIRFDTYYSRYEKMEKSKNILDGFNKMAHDKNIKTWIKNIEEKDGYNLVNELGIDFIQGRYISEIDKFYEK